MPLRLHDIDDGVRFAGAIANRSRLELSYHDAEDLRQFLVTELWLLSLRYDPAASSVRFSTWAGTTLRLRVTDWTRQRFGRTRWSFSGHTYERPRPSLVTLDARLDDPLSTGQAILRTVATSASQGYSTVEIARGFGTSKRWVLNCLDELREEIERTEVARRGEKS